MCCLSRPFLQAISVQNFRTFTVNYLYLGKYPEILELITFEETPLNVHAVVFRGTRCLKFDHHLHPYFVYASCKGFGESVFLHRFP